MYNLFALNFDARQWKAIYAIPLLLIAMATVTVETGCNSQTLAQSIVAAAGSVAAIADPVLMPYVKVAQDAVTCAFTPGTAVQKVDACLATALNDYQLAYARATVQEQALISVVINAIEGLINANAPAGSASVARAKVSNPHAVQPSAAAFRAAFNKVAPAAGAKKI